MMDSVHPILFSEDELPRRPLHDPQEARERLQAMLDKMRAAASWPWKAATVSSYRESLWPSLLGRLADDAEAARFRAEIEAEAARLDAAD
jgi:hypothetical protein